MIETTRTNDGRFRHATMICGNQKCNKVISTWTKESHVPSPDQSKYWLYSVVVRVRLVDRLGRPVQALIDQGKYDLPIFFPNLKGGGVGYQLAPGTYPLAEDFCSGDCAAGFVNGNQEWNLCIRQEAGRIQFVADEPRWFQTRELMINI